MRSPTRTRVATDLNLHRKTQTAEHDSPEGLARDKEVHNRERTWLVCFMLDRSYGAQMGKPFTIKEECVLSLNSLRLVCLISSTQFHHPKCIDLVAKVNGSIW